MNDDNGEKRDDQTATTNDSSTTEAKPVNSEVAAASSAEVSNASPKVAATANVQPATAAPATSSGVANAGAGTSPAAAPSTNLIRRILWLDERVAQARAGTFGHSQPGWAEYDAARHAREGVVQIGETGQSSWAVLLLERTAASLLLRAHAARAAITIGAGPLVEADWESVRKIPVIQEAWNNLSAVQVSALVEALGPEGDQSTAHLPIQQRKSFALGLHNFVKTLAEPLEFEANRLGRALFARYARVAIAVVSAIIVVSGFINWLGARFEKPNIALHRAVEVSSQYPGAGEDHTLLVDGDRTNLGFHTNCEGPQFAIVDLGAAHKIDKVVVYNRDEFPERAVPLYLEVGSDRQNFKQVAVKKEPFDKWAATGLGATGRYIRLRNTPPNCFHLAEVEVY
jgi:hypothetical protein